ncbi:MAG: hypothetical protein M1834_001199 [Cirrosporium novae-zelandiae]|nr:MAG: hypothetical protein M1834_001199 [Cirrosporium novae-zelandiae]
MDHNASILIIGSGTFGLSTAYHLAKRGYTNITAIDKHPCPSLDSAGNDLNKIIRTEYDEPLYAEMALEAMEAWREPLFDGIFHETGWIVTTCGEPKAAAHLRQSYQNLIEKHGASGIEMVETPEDIIRHVPQLKDTKTLSNWKGLWNQHAGWAHASKAMEKVASEAQKLGVTFVSGPDGEMVSLETTTSPNKITGIKTASGKIWTASHYILCTGAASPALLPELSPQLWSKCWTAAHISLTPSELSQFQNMPVVDNHELGFFFEPDPETSLLKICNATPGYQNKVGSYNGVPYSIPHYLSSHPDEGIPTEALAAINNFIDNVIPQFSGRPLVGARYCWCTDTPDQHFLLTPHPKYEGSQLILATGDSGHAFKFLPTIGAYIADCLEGKPNGNRDVWGWRERGEWKADPTRPGDVVKDLRDVEMGMGMIEGSRG